MAAGRDAAPALRKSLIGGGGGGGGGGLRHLCFLHQKSVNYPYTRDSPIGVSSYMIDLRYRR